MKGIRKLAFRSIQTRLSLVIFFVVVLPIIFVNLLYFRNSEAFVQERMQEANEQVLSIVGSKIESFMDEIIAASNIICFDTQLNRILAERGDKNALEYPDMVKIEEVIGRAKNGVLLNTVLNISVFDQKGNVLSVLSSANENLNDYFSDLHSVERIINKEGRIEWIAPHLRITTSNGGGENFITLGRLISPSSRYGILVISVNEEQFYRKNLANIDDLIDDDFLFLQDDMGRIISHTDRELVGALVSEGLAHRLSLKNENHFIERLNKSRSFVSWREIGNTGWFLVKLSNYDQKVRELTAIKPETLIFLALVLVAYILITILISHWITVPIRKLRQLVDRVEKGDLKASLPFKGSDEIAELGRGFNQMVQKTNELIDEIKEEQRLKEKLELDLIQAQINPHFIFNTLNTIKWTAIINQASNTAELIEDFGRIIGACFKGTDKLITIDKEFANLRSYLNIQKARFNYLFRENILVPDELRSCLVPKLLLQPLVENAIIHGYQEGQILNLEVEVEAINGKLSISVNDDGVGISMKVLDHIKENLDSDSDSRILDGIGLFGVHKRIQLMFGEDFGIRIQSNLGNGTMVKLLLPLIREGDGYDKRNDSG